VSGKTWQAVDVTVSGNAREAIEYGMMEAGALGTEAKESAGNVAITGYYHPEVDEAKLRQGLLDALRIYNLPVTPGVELNFREVADADWLEEWKKHWQPIAVGRFIIAPPWSELPASADGSGEKPIIIRINPGMAFGTGTHETTRLCLKAIEKHFHGGSFLDVGTGTGILAIAAAKMFPEARIEALDTDAEAIEIAKENAQLNMVRDGINFAVGSIDEQTASADLVCANLTAPVRVELLPGLLGVTCGTLVLSGILESQIEMIETRLSELAAQTLEISRDAEWVSITV
jgi:ribosomal protein L11 methyltransferase